MYGQKGNEQTDKEQIDKLLGMKTDAQMHRCIVRRTDGGVYEWMDRQNNRRTGKGLMYIQMNY